VSIGQIIVAVTSVVLLLASAIGAPGAAARVVRPGRDRVLVTQTTADLSQAMTRLSPLRFSPGVAAGIPAITIDDRVHDQSFIGVGAAMTDSSAWLIWDGLPPARRTALLSRLFSRSGAHLGFLRLPMGASDFSATGVPYTYDDLPAGQTDPTLAHFSIAHDKAYILPAVRQALADNPSLYTEAVPWSPPAWMKVNDALDNVGHAGALQPRYEPALARYFVRYLRAYAAAGVDVSAIAPQNEPGVPAAYPGMQWSAAQEARFIARDLRPALSGAHLDPDIYGWDLSFARLGADEPLTREAAGGVITGLAYHCYFQPVSWMDVAHRYAPHATSIVDECSTGAGDAWSTSELLIASFRHWASAVALWNLALDPAGGPVQPPDSGCGGCTGVVTISAQTGTYTLSRDYFQLAQLSRFVTEGAIRIPTTDFVTYGQSAGRQTVVSAGVDDVGFVDPDGSHVLIAYNNNPADAITFQVKWHSSHVTYSLPPGATVTFDWR